ncbi:MAG: DegT/DnrJ/EryC1/StrS family aminotransferase [Alphaproteobacteria bacterium]
MKNKISIPFVDLARQFRSIEPELTQAFHDVGRSGIYIMGERLSAFERMASEFIGTKHAIGVASGADALFLVMKSLGIGPGDEVITAPNSFLASAWTIIATGATPVFADVSEDMNIDPAQIRRAITVKTRGIIPVHLTGRPADMDAINDIAKEHNLFVLEDAAQAIGAKYKGRRVGSLGTAAAFSLHPLKNLGIYGDGGLITTDDDELASHLMKIRNHGLINRDECELWGYNSRLDPMQAAFAEIKLGYLEKWNERCRSIARVYRESLNQYVEVPRDHDYEYSVYHNFVIRTDKRPELIKHLQLLNIDTRIHYPIPIHLQACASKLGYGLGSFPRTEADAKRILSLPIYPELTDEEVAYVAESVRSYFKRVS